MPRAHGQRTAAPALKTDSSIEEEWGTTGKTSPALRATSPDRGGKRRKGWGRGKGKDHGDL